MKRNRFLLVLTTLLSSCSITFSPISSSSETSFEESVISESESVESSSSESSSSRESSSASYEELDLNGYSLFWHDEFDGTSLNTDNWNYIEGTGESVGLWAWGNNELQNYRQNNVSVQDSKLVITAKKERFANSNYTSGRLDSKNKFSFTYGYAEAKMSLPVYDGLWPAFWMLPQDTSIYGTWPQSGEIDIMEARGRIDNKVESTVHYGGTQNHQYYGKSYIFKNSTIRDYHTYGVEWTEEFLKFYVDGLLIFNCPKRVYFSVVSDCESAPFDVDFYLLLNLAVGGNFDGGIQPDEAFTQESMYVDYVRVYKK